MNEQHLENGICHHCGAKMVTYKHTINEAIIIALARLRSKGCAVNIKTLNLTRNQWDNFQKLRYWDLVKKSVIDGKRKGGYWEVTSWGRAFLDGHIKVSRNVVTYRGDRKEYDGEMVGVHDYLDARYKQRPEYAEDSTPYF